MGNFIQQALWCCWLIFVFSPLFSQKSDCGTYVSDQSKALMARDRAAIERHTQQFINQTGLNLQAPQVLPIQAFIFTPDNGVGGLSVTALQSAIKTLNANFAGLNVEFSVCSPTNVITSSHFYNYSSSSEAELTSKYYVPNTINVYFVGSIDAKGYAGYSYLPAGPDFIVLDYNHSNTSTFTHEMGHFFGLYHTHGKGNCETTDELVNDPNCFSTGDDVSDTPADPNLAGINCNGRLVGNNCDFIAPLKDAKGALYSPQVNNFMSFAPNACRTRFTLGQFARMDYYLKNVSNYFVSCNGANTCTLPLVNSRDIGDTYISLSWNYQANSTPFNFRYRQEGGASWITQSDFTANSISLSQLKPCTNYEFQFQRICTDAGVCSDWTVLELIKTGGCGEAFSTSTSSKVKAGSTVGVNHEFQMRLFCSNSTFWTGWSSSLKASTSPLSLVAAPLQPDPIKLLAVFVYPNPTTGLVTLQISGGDGDTGNLDLFDLQGRVIHSSKLIINSLQVEEIDLSGQPNGIYILRIKSLNQLITKRLVKE